VYRLLYRRLAMPSSRYVYADANQSAGSILQNRRRSWRIRRRTPMGGGGAPNQNDPDDDDDDAIDPDETVLERQLGEDDEMIASSPSDGEDAPPPPSRFGDVDVDEMTRRVVGHDRRGGGTTAGLLSNDAPTSSTMKSTPSSDIRARNAKENSRFAVTIGGGGERPSRGFVNRSDSDDDGGSERDLMREVARKRSERGASLAASRQRQQPRTQQQKRQQKEPSFASTRVIDESYESKRRQVESETTDRIGNNGTSSTDNQCFSESFAATQPWEKELDGLPYCERNAPEHFRHESNQDMQSSSATNAQPHIQQGRRSHGERSNQRPRHQLHSNFDSQIMICSSRHQLSESFIATENQHRVLKDVPNAQNHNEDESEQFMNDSEPQIQWCRWDEDQSNSMNQAPSNNFQLNNYSTMNKEQPLQIHDGSEFIHQDNHSEARSTVNPYLQKSSPPPINRSAANEPKISFHNIKSRNEEKISVKGNVDDDGNNSNGEGETWREKAFRSSLLDLLRSFPTNIFDYQDENERNLFVIENNDDESPHSTTQKAASSQLNRKRLFDAASRSLARLAIASRHRTNKIIRNSGSRASGGSSDDVESPDFNPPSPRSLPAFMSVMNVHDDSNPGTFWESGNANDAFSSSTEVFSGHSVHGRNARTLRLSKVPQSNNIPSSNPNPLSSWSSERLAFCSLLLAARVCDEASCDANVEEKHRPSVSEAESRHVAGSAQKSSKEGNEKRPEVLTSLVESCLGYLATAFSCLESDFVYSVLKSTPRSHNTVFDTLSQYAPVSSQDDLSGEICTASLLALSRGLEATVTVALLTSLDPSSACVAYSSPQQYCGTQAKNIIDNGIDGGGVGWSSALGRDLGLKLEDYQSSRPRHMHLSQIAMYVYDCILDFNPTTVNDETNRFHRTMNRDDKGVHRGDSRSSHYIDTQGSNCQGIDAAACRQPSVMKDRMYAANVEYLTSSIRVGIVSGWLTSVSAPTHVSVDPNDSNCVRTVDKLCQKLFYIIETISRRRRSTNQNIASPDPGDSEAVCTASLTLLILILPEQAKQLEPSSLSTSFRQIGQSVGSIDDLLHSPLIRRMVDMALSWQDPRSSMGNNKKNENQAISNAMYFLGNVCMVGGSSLICSHFGKKLEHFFLSFANNISERGSTRTAGQHFDDSNIDSCLFFVLQLHTRSPIIVRTFLRNFIESDNSNSFSGGLLHLATNESFAVSSCASSLLRALVGGNPADRTTDRLSEIMLESFYTGSDFEDALQLLFEITYTYLTCDIPNYSIRCYPRICSLGDLLLVFIHTTCANETFASSMSDDVLDLLGNILECDPKHNQSIDSLSGSARMSIITLFATFAINSRKVIADDKSGFVHSQQRRVKEKLICAPGHLAVLEAAMAQGTSADMTYRALKLQSALLPLGDERLFAHMFTNSRNSVAKKMRTLTDKLATIQSEMREMTEKCVRSELKCDGLIDSLRNQILAYERQLEWTRSEYRMTSKNASEICVYERKLAEERFAEERRARLKIERENEQLICDCSSYRTRIKELEDLWEHEHSSRQEFESALRSCKNELSTTSKELEKMSSVCNDLKEKLSVAEDKVSHLTAITDESEASLEDVCSKLVKLSTIYQVNAQEMERYKAQLRSATNTANRHAEKAIEKYDSAKQKNALISKKLVDVTNELYDIKARRADVQRMRKNAPVAYLNQLHKDATASQRVTLQEASQRRSPRRQGKN
ncbi:hypothetical protein ACHAXA_003650, partial [Cyclostephanos tholiformis]